MPTPIAPDDLCPDLWITLRAIPEEEPPPDFIPGAEMAWMMRRRCRSRLRPGYPLRVLAVDLPYLFVAFLDPDGDEAGPFILDIREQPVVRLDESVPAAIHRFAELKRRHGYARQREAACREAEIEATAEAAREQRMREAGVATDHDAGSDDDPASDRNAKRQDRLRRSIEADVEAHRRRLARRHRRRHGPLDRPDPDEPGEAPGHDDD